MATRKLNLHHLGTGGSHNYLPVLQRIAQRVSSSHTQPRFNVNIQVMNEQCGHGSQSGSEPYHHIFLSVEGLVGGRSDLFNTTETYS